MIGYDHIHGSKGTLILIHGSAGTRRKWRLIMDNLPESFAGLALDLPGHGESCGPSISDIQNLSAAVADFIRSHDMARPLILVGHSLGGAIVQTIAINEPELADYLVLIGTGAKLPMAADKLDKIKHGIVKRTAKRSSFSPHTAEDLINEEIDEDLKTPIAVLYDDLLACNSFDATELLSRIISPTLIIVGADDTPTPISYSEILLSGIKHAQLHIIPYAGHEVMLEQPNALLDVLSSFLTHETNK